MPKKPLDGDPYYPINIDSLIAIATKTINPRRALGGKKLTAGQFEAFVKLVEITWLELCYLLRIDVLDLEGYKTAVDLPDKMRQQFLEILVVYGIGYSHCGAPHLFNQWMRRERETLGYMSPISLLSSQMGRRAVTDWIKHDEWAKCKAVRLKKKSVMMICDEFSVI